LRKAPRWRAGSFFIYWLKHELMNHADRLSKIRHVALDLDGTLYTDDTPYACTAPFLSAMEALGIGCTFLTNNCSRSTHDYVTRLRKMGIAANETNMYTSADATIEYLRCEMPELRRLFIFGTPSLVDQFRASGYEVCGEDLSDEPDAVVLAFDKTMTYARLCRTAYWIAQGKPYVATHPDRVCPTNEPTVLVDCGAFQAALKLATGREPSAVLGKPNPRMLQGIMKRHQLGPENLAMVGDRLYTDMAMARNSGALAVLVLTGEATAEEAAAMETPPDLILGDIGEFAALLTRNRSDASCKTNP
jgi:HAD superfamily hydrolase (TIGR01450 family)